MFLIKKILMFIWRKTFTLDKQMSIASDTEGWVNLALYVLNYPILIAD